MTKALTIKILMGIKYVLFAALVGLLFRAHSTFKNAGHLSMVTTQLSTPLVIFVLLAAMMITGDIVRGIPASGPVPPRRPAMMPPAARGPVPPAARGPVPPAARGPVPPAARGPVPPAARGPVPPQARMPPGRSPSRSPGVSGRTAPTRPPGMK